MDTKEKSRFDTLYQKSLAALTRQGKADKTIDAYTRAVRRLTDYVDRSPENLNINELKSFFSALIDTHSWSTVKLDLNGLRFFYKHVLDQELPWIDIVKPPKVQSMPDILTPGEIARIIHHTRDLRLQSFWFITYSMGLRLSETLNITVADIDRARHTLHVRQSKGRKDRFVILPQMSLAVLQRLWRSHHHPLLLFPGKPRIKGNLASKTMHLVPPRGPFPRSATTVVSTNMSLSIRCATIPSSGLFRVNAFDTIRVLFIKVYSIFRFSFTRHSLDHC